MDDKSKLRTVGANTGLVRFLGKERQILFSFFPHIEGQGAEAVPEIRRLPEALVEIGFGQDNTFAWCEAERAGRNK